MSNLTGIACNTPQGHYDIIPSGSLERSVWMAEFSRAHGADFVVMAEFGPSLVEGWKSQGWNVYLGPNNNGAGQRYACNAVAWNPEVLKFEDVEIFSFPFTDHLGRKRRIHIPVLQFRVKATDERVAIFAVHVPTRRDASDFLRGWINIVLKAYAKKVSRKGIVPVVAGDRNDGQPEPWWSPDYRTDEGSFFRLAQHQVDWIIGRVATKKAAGCTLIKHLDLPGVFRKASDHKAAVLAKFRLDNATYRDDVLPPKPWKYRR